MLFNQYRNNKLMKFSDSELILHYKKTKNNFVIAIFYERYVHLVLGVCLKYLRQKEDAEDLTLNIYSNLSSKIEKHEITYFKSWLFQVTKNECLQFLRNKHINWNIEEYSLELAEEETHASIYKEVQLQEMEKAINFLKDEQRMCIELFYIQNKSYQDISDELSLSLNAVKSAIQNGKRNLKIWMEKNEKK